MQKNVTCEFYREDINTKHAAKVSCPLETKNNTALECRLSPGNLKVTRLPKLLSIQ